MDICKVLRKTTYMLIITADAPSNISNYVTIDVHVHVAKYMYMYMPQVFYMYNVHI